ncbi:MAG: Arc family DNA-binding protein [Alphaproteobacteria bacterium]|nr:MAG: Arc family DNA-binding protein [Alphaproteobacteria bacterium]
MATLTIRRLPEEVYDSLKERARNNGRSLEAEAREILAERARPVDALVDDLRAFHAEMVAAHGLLPDSTLLIRQMRDEE